MSTDKEVIGQGIYGCIHKPSVRCEENPEPGFDYNKYVSKFMLKKDAIKEFNEFLIIDNIDKNNDYHLGRPIMCKPNLIFPTEKNAIKKCKRFNFNDIQQNPNNYSLLLLKYGGYDLKDFCTNYLNTFINVDRFWFSLNTLLEGIKLFHSYKISHNDIKPHNILFNPSTYEFRYIDFGLMDSYENMENTSLHNENALGIFHWSYPLETGFINNEQFVSYKEKSKPLKIEFQNKLTNSIINGDEIEELENPEQFNTLFKFLYINPDKNIVEQQINAFFNGFNDFISSVEYEEGIKMIIQSMDLFGLGFTIQYVANSFYKMDKIDKNFYDKLTKLCEKMYNFNILHRELNIQLLIDEYKSILEITGVLERLRHSKPIGGFKKRRKQKTNKKKYNKRKRTHKKRSLL